MPEILTIGKTPETLPYLEHEYSSSFSASFATWFYQDYRRRFISAADKIESAIQRASVEEGEARPSPAAIAEIVRLVKWASKTEAMSEPDVSIFHGEAIVTWERNGREVSLLSKGSADDPKLLRYESGQDHPGNHRIYVNATGNNLIKALSWLYA
jgi:hypothetical protein